MSSDRGFPSIESGGDDSQVDTNSVQKSVQKSVYLNNFDFDSKLRLIKKNQTIPGYSQSSCGVDNTIISEDRDLLDGQGLIHLDRPKDEPQITIGKWGQKILAARWFLFYDVQFMELKSVNVEIRKLYCQQKERFGEGLTDNECRAVNDTRQDWLQYCFGHGSSVRREPDGPWNVTGPYEQVGHIKARHLRPPPGESRVRGSMNTSAPSAGKPLVLHELASWATPESVDIRLLGTVPVSAVEIWTFFPYHIRWSGFMDRFVNRDIPMSQIVYFMTSVRNVKARNVHENHLTMGNKYWKRNERKKDEISNNRSNTINFTCGHWVPPEHMGKDRVPIDYHLIDLATGIWRAKFPTGADKGPLTWAIEHALDHDECTDVRLSDVKELVWTVCFPARCKHQFWMDDGSDNAAYLKHKKMIDHFRNVLI